METNYRGTVRHAHSHTARSLRAKKFRALRSFARRQVKQIKRKYPKITSKERKALVKEACLVIKSRYRNGNHGGIKFAANPAPRVQEPQDLTPKEKRIRVTFDEGTHDGLLIPLCPTEPIVHPVVKTFQNTHDKKPSHLIQFDNVEPSAVDLLDGQKLVDEDNDHHSYRILKPYQERDIRQTKTFGFVGPKTAIRIISHNVQTLGTHSPQIKLSNIVCMMKDAQADIHLLQEHKIRIPESTADYVHRRDIGDGWLFFHTNAETAANQQSPIGGVGIIISRVAARYLQGVTSISPRILQLTFQTHSRSCPQLSVFSIYAPPNTYPDAQRSAFFTTLSATLQQQQAHALLLVGGDFQTDQRHRNPNSELFTELLNERSLYSTLRNRKSRLPHQQWTFQHLTNLQRVLYDHILINRKWKNSVRRTCVLPNMEVPSDHRPVLIEIRLSLRAPTPRNPHVITRRKWDLTRTDPEIALQLSTDINHRMNQLAAKHFQDPHIPYPALIKEFKQAARLLPKVTRHERIHHFDAKALRSLRRKIRRAATTGNRAGRKLLQRELYARMHAAEAAYISERCDQIQEASEDHQTRLAYALINELTGRKSSVRAGIRADSPADCQAKWKEYLSNLFKNTQPPDPEEAPWTPHRIHEPTLDMPTGPATVAELQAVIAAMANNKATGEDEVTAELLKLPDLAAIILPVINSVLETQQPPTEWLTAIMIMLPKKGNLSKPENYRSIALASITAKLYNKLLLWRLTPVIDPLLRKNQNGFRRGRATSTHIMALRRLTELARLRDSPTVFTFIDFVKAFDSVYRDRMFKILAAYGVPEKAIAQIRALYINSCGRARIDGALGDPFPIEQGILQGDTLAPYLFVIVIDYVLRRTDQVLQTLTNAPPAEPPPRRITRSITRAALPQQTTDLDFADDIALIDPNVNTAQIHLLTVEQEALAVGLRISCDKTKYVAIPATLTHNCPPIHTRDGSVIEMQEDFKYLGSYMDTTTDVKHRIASAWTATKKLFRIWKSQISQALKRKFFMCMIMPILLYGCESWALDSTLTQKLHANLTRLLRFSLNVHWSTHTRNADLYDYIPRIADTLRYRRVKFAGHALRADQPVASLLSQPDPSRNPTPLTIQSVLIDDLASPNLLQFLYHFKHRKHCMQKIQQEAEDRDKWRTLVDKLPLRPPS